MTKPCRRAIRTEREACALLAEQAGRADIAQAIRTRTAAIGRPAMPYDHDQGLAICAGIAGGITLKELCEADDMPSTTTVYKWLVTTTTFAASYARARDQQMDVWADDIVTIADDARNDVMDRVIQNGGTERVLDPENINRSKLRIDTRKWIMARLASKRYGDRIEIEQTVTIETVPDHEMQARVLARMERLGITPPPMLLRLGHEPAPKAPKANGDAIPKCHPTDDHET